MTAVDDNAVDFIDDFNDRQVAREDSGQRRVLPGAPVKQRTQIQAGGAVRISIACR